jgi:TPP-dependent pyruvate/acetoin dehydrogenase alpha subunit
MRQAGTDRIGLYETMARIRSTELLQNQLWARGLISGEMHSGIGEEAVAAGVAAHLVPGDAIACDHRPTGPFLAAGVHPGALLLELVGHADGMNGGRAGHMHLTDRGRLLVADGIVGASGPLACGFALSAEHRRPGAVAVAFFGEGALNQGMLMEALNLARVWSLPVLFVCKDNGWSITTRTADVSSVDPQTRASGFGLPYASVKGFDVVAVDRVAGRMIDRIRVRREPAFLHVRCVRPDGHFLGDPLVRVMHDPVGETRDLAGPLMAAVSRPDGSHRVEQARAAVAIGRRVARFVATQRRWHRWDPLVRARRRLDRGVTEGIDRRVQAELAALADDVFERIGVER